ncbi:MAG: EthD domain-containing protein [Eubacteriaceae bacterium]|nr:EthD domain-containing protein [Eubacteriaceae bacterium]
MVKVTQCITRHPEKSYAEFTDWLESTHMPQISKLKPAKANASSLTSLHSSTKDRMIPQRKYDCLIEICFDDVYKALGLFSDSAFAAICEAAYEGYIDESNSLSFAASIFPPVIGVQPNPKAKLINFMVKNESLNFEAFALRHKTEHIELFASLEEAKKNVKGYSITHRLTELDGIFSDAYDGTAELFFGSAVEMYSLFASDGYKTLIRPDELELLEFGQCDFFVARDMFEHCL